MGWVLINCLQNFIIHFRAYRYAAYRQFCWFAHGKLGKKIRRVLPSCVISKVREEYPSKSGRYTGFKDAEEDDSEIALSWSAGAEEHSDDEPDTFIQPIPPPPEPP